MQLDQARRFLAKVVPWPEEGDELAYVNIHNTFATAGYDRVGWSGRACRSVDEAVSAIGFIANRSGSRDIYFCTSSQSSAIKKMTASGWGFCAPLRNQANVVRLKSLFLDLDWKGHDKGSYANADEAASALAEFINSVGLPKPSAIVSSGGGLHVYWTMARALTIDEWRPLAFALAEAGKQNGLKFDSQCTIDAARILRVPDTQNFKTDPPKKVSLLGITDFDYTVERIETSLEPYKVPVPKAHSFVEDMSLFPRREVAANDNDLAAGVNMSRGAPVNLDAAAVECPFINEAITTGGALFTNPLWNITTLMATFTEGALTDAHRMACNHPGYTPESTEDLFERKVREREEKDLGWPMCRTISGTGSSKCATCPHFAKGKSPFNFAARPQPPIVTGAVTPQVTAPTTQTQTDMPSGYARRSDGLVCLLATKDDGSAEYIPMAAYRMDDPWLQTTPEFALNFSTMVERGKTKTITLPCEAVGSNEMRKHLQMQGLMLPAGAKGAENAARFFVAWITKLQETRDGISASPFGWSVDRRTGLLEGFVFNGALWTPNGDRVAGVPDSVIARHYEPLGTMEPWKAAAKMITDQGRPEIEAIVASAFAAPLIRFTGEPGVLMSAYSQASGIGKSTALKVAQAVWGDPVKAVQSLSDTQNATMNKLGEIRSLPLYWDELKTEEDTRKFVNITFQVTQGKEKARMTSRITQREPGSWQTLLVSASNDSLLDYVLAQTNMTTAGLYRVFEYRMEKPAKNAPGQIAPSEASLLVAKLRDNYGLIGGEYAKFLGMHHEQIAKDMAAYLRALGDEVKTGTDERFWLALIATVCLGARYANHLGFASFDEVKLKAFMLSVLARMRAVKIDQPVDMEDATNVSHILTQFLKEMRARHTLRTNKIHVSRGKPAAGTIKIVSDPSRLEGIHVQVGVEDKLMRISSNRLGEWLSEHKRARHMFMLALEKELGFQKVVGRLGSGCGPDIAGGTEYLLQIDLSGTPLMNFVDGGQ